LEVDDSDDYDEFLNQLRLQVEKIQSIKDKTKRDENIQLLIKTSLKYADNIINVGEYFEAGEFLYSVAELMETNNNIRVYGLYEHIIKLFKKVIKNFIAQAKLHEIAEIYLKIADIYGEKLINLDLEKQNIKKSINYLIQESNLLEDFSETRKLAQNYQNIAELYLRISEFEKAITYFKNVISISKKYNYYDLMSYSFRQIASCYEEIDRYNDSKEILLDAVEYFASLIYQFEEKNNNLTVSQICQILKNLYKILKDDDQYIIYNKKEASAYINLAESLEKKEDNYQKIAMYYRGAGLCYQETNNNLIESASCFVLAGNYSEKIQDYNEAATNFLDAAIIFKKLNNLDMAYKHFIKAGDNFWKIGDANQSTEHYLNAYDIVIEGNLEFNRYGIFNQIIRGLNKVAEDGLKNKHFYTAATLILESIKFYEKLETSKDFLLKELVRNVYKYYYAAANLKNIGLSNIVYSYVLASLSCIVIGQLDKAWQIISEIRPETETIKKYKKMIKLIINWVSTGKPVELDNFPFNIRRLIECSEGISYMISLFKRV